MYRAQRKVYMNHKPLRNQHHVCLHFRAPKIIFSPSKNLRTSSALAPIRRILRRWISTSNWNGGGTEVTLHLLDGYLKRGKGNGRSRGCDFLPLAHVMNSIIFGAYWTSEAIYILYLDHIRCFPIRVSENGTLNNSFYRGNMGKWW